MSKLKLDNQLLGTLDVEVRLRHLDALALVIHSLLANLDLTPL
jgi:hypothetical protein